MQNPYFSIDTTHTPPPLPLDSTFNKKNNDFLSFGLMDFVFLPHADCSLKKVV